MTDQQTYTTDDGTVLLEVRPDWRSAKNGKLLIKLPIVSDYDSVVIPAAELLAMIDRLDPDAMRAYLRETIEHEVPEADSPEDVDERDPVEQMRETVRQLGETLERALTEAQR